MTIPDALRRVLPSLRCPVCGDPVALADTEMPAVRCGRGHSFDVARQGYVGMLTGRGVNTGDTTAMVAARSDVFVAGLLDGVMAAVVRAAVSERGAEGLVLDLAGGSGHYLAAVLDAAPAHHGLCVDASTPALRRAGRSHPRTAAVAADAWGRLPLADGVVACVLSVFGPRNAAELDRVLRPDGRIIVASPAVEHLAELVEPLGLVRVDPRKAERQADTFAHFTEVARDTVRYERPVAHSAVTALVGMGPSAVHLDDEDLVHRVASLPPSVTTTVAVNVTTYRR